MIQDIEFRFEQTDIKAYQMVVFMESVFVVHRIDELEDPYCLANLLVFAQVLLGEVERRPVGKLYGKNWNAFAPTWIAYEAARCYTWQLGLLSEDDGSATLSVKTGLPYQSRPETKVNLKIHAPSLARAILAGLARRYD